MTLAFLALGFLVGNLTALSASPVAAAVVPALFTLAGGSVLAFLSNVPQQDRPVAANAILSFSLACLVGTYLGIVVNSHQLLGPVPPPPPPPPAVAGKQQPQSGGHYLRDTDIAEVDAIDQRVRGGSITYEDAYARLLVILRKR
jgi:hypothetical protein